MLNSDTLKNLILNKMQSFGFNFNNAHAQSQYFAQAIAEAVVEHVQAEAQVNVSGGSSSGTYKVQ